MCAHDVVVEDVGAGLEVDNGAGDYVDAVVGSSGHVYTLYDLVNKLNILQMPECLWNKRHNHHKYFHKHKDNASDSNRNLPKVTIFTKIIERREIRY